MRGTIVVLVNGEVLANGQGSKMPDQLANARIFAEKLSPILTGDIKLAVLHGNKPQVGFVLFRSELTNHILHTVPLDFCGADTQGATGYMLSQSFMNVLNQARVKRNVMTILTQTLVDASLPLKDVPLKAIGPWFDREKAEQNRQTRGWNILEEPGRGYRRAVPSFPAKEIIEIEEIRRLVDWGDVVIAGGGGGIPVIRNAQGDLEGIESVIDTEHVACLFAQQLNANILLMVVEDDTKFLLAGLSVESANFMELDQVDKIIAEGHIQSSTVMNELRAASQFLHTGGEQVVITTLHKLSEAINGQSGLRIGSKTPSIDLSSL